MQRFESNSPLLPEILSLHGKWRATQEAVICSDVRLDWRQFTQSYHQFAHGLNSHGIDRRDGIGIVMSNGFPMLQAMMACMALGVVSVPINLSVNDEGLINMLKDAEVSALIVSSDQQNRIDAIRPSLPSKIELFVCDKPNQEDWISFASIMEGQKTSLPRIAISDNDSLNIIYSSGTTGMPKGIVHTQAGRRDWAYDLAIALRYHCQSRTLLTIGLYSNISWVAMLTTLLAGGTLVISDKFEALDALKLIEKEKITHTAMVPIQFQRIVEYLEQSSGKLGGQTLGRVQGSVDLSSMNAMMSCGSPLHAELKQKIFDYFPCGIIELYGLTEGVITTIDPEQSQGRWSSVGKPLIGTDILIVDEDDRPLAANQSGEIVSRGRITMPGYLNRPEANLAASYKDDRGATWLRTGDIGYVDEDGFLYIVDRKKDMILSGGQNIYPQDIEAIMVEHPAVSEVAVISAKSNRWGETPIALVVVEGDKSIDLAELKSWSNIKLGKQQRVADVFEIGELPRNPNGKILKRELRTRYADLQYD